MQTAENIEHLNFQAEANQLLKLMIHSLYSNKEIFLRELISNASDAADKLRFEGLSDAALYESDPDLKIRIAYDKEARTITIIDNGIGMSRQEVINNIGTIAKSGTREFFDSLTGDQAKDANLIGQFGVGFYSAFIVADKVTLTTRRAGLTIEHGVRWESGGEGEYTLETVEKPDRGTEIVLHLREGEDELLSSFQLRSIIRKYSDHITLPIVMKKEVWDDESKSYRLSDEDETINQASAIWARPKNEITQEQYDEFYKHVAHDFEPPLAHVHARVEGKQEYIQLLYIPAHAPFDLFDREHRHGLKLYVRRVFIMDDAEKLLPGYLRFVRGIIDSSDLPLNVSREILQESKDIDSIRAGSVKKVLGLIEDLAMSDKSEDQEKFKTFWREFGQVLKEGIAEDYSNRERIAKLLRFTSTHDEREEQTVSLDDYIARMKPEQEKIYYITADGLKAAQSSPHLEIFRKKGIEVLLLCDRIDEWLVANLNEYTGKSLQSIAKGNLDLGKLEDEEEKKEHEKEAGDFQELTNKMKEVLGEQVKDVRITYRLTESPACLVADTHDVSGNLGRLLKSAGQKVPDSKPFLEINPHHPMIQRLKYEEAKFADWSHILFDQALLAEGGQLEDPAGFVKRLNDLLLQNILSGK
ncbi:MULTISPECIES: molecular chaperone HtpG [Nitrosomonas]|uniref:Chaperone protein HtpG n=1 Tax=Nitrosomonas europaea (strain ATCC 19718 / CIP 103999 / KCTC 2705 / NBRC 14298) TaxID=228410 RepID=HTPG_NITEU|nr:MULTISPECIES: molecular chaperone HtpG [Nitrosomonas]Q82TV8.1 RecName: Full=Chaperone protein HtpG; AltName: Full=Heat shock protein HtpG; AltName: Full=High temperature protein G [Nitrosomonas europaea ATCC 19718]KXK35473.1 MAG: heat shock protein 90 [Nitrosomonas europaea]CAD85673.1 probable hptG; chaperone (heat shock protein htpg) [Nitrosomonas europaea ATCC 19718]SDW77068.1 molecular chaperone HtpG [Nitrosomonas europaea]SET31027.1 molecular chaperone HtpG [Nitrosomonas europaea]SJZ86